MLSKLIRAYNAAVFETDKEAAFEVINRALAEGMTPEDIIIKLVVPAVEEVMTALDWDPDANLAQQFMTAQIASEVTDSMLALTRFPPQPVGRVVIGTALGDLHTLGKRIVIGCLKSLMVEVFDLGGNVPAERFVDEAQRLDARVIGISSMMVHTATGPEGCRKVREILCERGLEHQIKIVVGGAPYRFDSELYKSVGADAWAADGISGARLIVGLIRRIRCSDQPRAPIMAGEHTMTPLEILSAACNGRPAPRIPIFCSLLDQGARELGITQKEYYAHGENVAEAQLKMLARYGHDNVWCLSYVGVEAELLGCREILFNDEGAPNVADLIIKSYGDIAKLEVPADITATPAWARNAACLKILRKEVGATHSICAYITASTTLPSMLMGMEQWMQLLTNGPTDLRDELLRKCSDFCRQELAAFRAAGANVLIYSTPFGSTYFVGMKRFKEWSLPWMRRDLAPGGTGNLVYYCGMAPFNNVIGIVAEEFGFRSYYISPLADLGEAKALISGNALIADNALTCGVIDDIRMAHWTSEETRAEVKRLCEIGKPGGHFLFGTGVVPMNVSEANIRAMLDAAFEYGRMP